jgi:hypothetical protein
MPFRMFKLAEENGVDVLYWNFKKPYEFEVFSPNLHNSSQFSLPLSLPGASYP